MSSAPEKVYVVIATHNAMPWVERCFTSIRNSSYPLTTVVVDNASVDETVVTIARDFPEVTIITNAVNLGFGAANNQGMNRALRDGADYIFLLNQDTWIFPDTVEKLVEAVRREPQFGIASPIHYCADEKTYDDAFCSYLVKEYAEQPDMLPQGIYPAPFINAAAWLIQRKCLEHVGGFGDLFYHYGEDRDYVQRLHYFHYKLGFVNSAGIVHDRPPRRFVLETLNKTVWYYSVGAKARLADINRPYAIAWMAVWFWFVKDMVALLFKGKAFALPALFKVFYSVFIRGSKSITRYRSAIRTAKQHKFLFILTGGPDP